MRYAIIIILALLACLGCKSTKGTKDDMYYKTRDGHYVYALRTTRVSDIIESCDTLSREDAEALREASEYIKSHSPIKATK